jgi:hypothetical protein
MTTAHDFPEDAVLENGNYQNRCCECGVLFVGYKRRMMCKICHNLVSAGIDAVNAAAQAERAALTPLARLGLWVLAIADAYGRIPDDTATGIVSQIIEGAENYGVLTELGNDTPATTAARALLEVKG